MTPKATPESPRTAEQQLHAAFDDVRTIESEVMQRSFAMGGKDEYRQGFRHGVQEMADAIRRIALYACSAPSPAAEGLPSAPTGEEE